MSNAERSRDGHAPHIFRLNALSPLTQDDHRALRTAELQARRLVAHRDWERDGEGAPTLTILLAGWAARVRYFADGRRQIVNFLLPGDMVAPSGVDVPGSIYTLTAATLARAPAAEGRASGLGAAYQRSEAVERHYLLSQIARLGRLSAEERIVDLLLELDERLTLTGLSVGHRFALPTTQEMLADCLGMTAVHINRTLNALRRKEVLESGGGMMRLIDVDRLRAMVDFQPLPLSALRGTATGKRVV